MLFSKYFVLTRFHSFVRFHSSLLFLLSRLFLSHLVLRYVCEQWGAGLQWERMKRSTSLLLELSNSANMSWHTKQQGEKWDWGRSHGSSHEECTQIHWGSCPDHTSPPFRESLRRQISMISRGRVIYLPIAKRRRNSSDHSMWSLEKYLLWEKDKLCLW